MRPVVHIRPLREVFDYRIGDYVLRGRDIERHEAHLALFRNAGYEVRDVPDDGQEHSYYIIGLGARPCRFCSIPRDNIGSA